MVLLIPLTALLMASDAGAFASRSTAVRAVDGVAVNVTVRARIIRASARVGPGRGPPAPRMTPRHTFVSAADGRPVPALVYDFE